MITEGQLRMSYSYVKSILFPKYEMTSNMYTEQIFLFVKYNQYIQTEILPDVDISIGPGNTNHTRGQSTIFHICSQYCYWDIFLEDSHNRGEQFAAKMACCAGIINHGCSYNGGMNLTEEEYLRILTNTGASIFLSYTV